MKLLAITSLKEHQKAVSGILAKSEIHIFSVTETIGFKDHQRANLLDDWFSSGGDYFNSIVVFAFTSDVNANSALQQVELHNKRNDTGFPIRAFVMPVDQSTYIDNHPQPTKDHS